MFSLQPEPDPEYDTDFDEEKYLLQPTSYSEPIPESKKKPNSFFTEDVPNIDRLNTGNEYYEAGFTLLASQSYDKAIEHFKQAISLLEQYVYYKYQNSTQKILDEKLCEFKVIDGYCHLAYCYQNVSHNKLAKVYYIKAIKILKNQYSRGEQLVQIIMNLSEAYSILGKPEMAKNLIKTHIPLAEAIFDEEHYYGVLSKLMVALADCNELDEAIEVGSHAASGLANTLGVSHPFTVQIISTLLKIIAGTEDKTLYDSVFNQYSEYVSLNTFEQTRQNIEDIEKESENQEEEMEKEKSDMLEKVQALQGPFQKVAQELQKNKRYDFSKELQNITKQRKE